MQFSQMPDANIWLIPTNAMTSFLDIEKTQKTAHLQIYAALHTLQHHFASQFTEANCASRYKGGKRGQGEKEHFILES